MLREQLNQRVLAKLVNARNELEDALSLSVPAARYDPIILPDTRRTEIRVMVNDLNHLIQHLDGVQ